MSRCSEGGGEAVQLGVVRALLTVTTAEHFVLHGDCLMQARGTPSLSVWPRMPLPPLRAAGRLRQAGVCSPAVQRRQGLQAACDELIEV